MREHCSKCHFPVRTCICHAVTSVKNRTEIIILQHPKEACHAKNTVKLLNLSLTNIAIFVGKTAQDFALLRHKLSTTPAATAVFYPSPDSTVICAAKKTATPGIERAIFIDASWKQAFGIWQRNSWLNTFPFYQLPSDYTGQYRIRRSSLAHSFSTLEAVAYGLQQIESMEPTPLLHLLDAFTSGWQGFIPGCD